MCGFMAQWILQSVWALHMQSRFGWSLRMVGVSLMVVGLATALVQGLLVRVAVPKLGERRALVVGLVMGVIGQAALGLGDQRLDDPRVRLPARPRRPRRAGRAGDHLASGRPDRAGGAPGLAQQPERDRGDRRRRSSGPTCSRASGRRRRRRTCPGRPSIAASAFNALGLLLALRLFARTRAAPQVTSTGQ